MSCQVKIEPITPKLHLGKGAHWDECSEMLYFVDMFQGTVHSYNPKNNSFITATVGNCACPSGPQAIIVPIKGESKQFVVSLQNDLSSISWDGISGKTSVPKVIQNLEPNDNGNRINNGKVDPKGRLWAGTTGKRLSEKELVFEENKAALYVLRNRGSATKEFSPVSIANGMEWSVDYTKFYFADSLKYQLEVFDFNYCSGKISCPKVIFDLKLNSIPGLLDGMTMDTDGKLYIANYLGEQIIVFDTKCNQMVNQIKIPAKEVTSVCWGGPHNDILFVTTGNTEPSPEYPCAGSVFQVLNLGVKGIPNKPVTL